VESGNCRCVLLTGAGRAFCAGGDVAAVREEALAGGSLPIDFFYEEYQLVNTIANLWHDRGIPQVSVWDGITMGGGVGLSAHGRFRVATEKTVMAKPETKIGLFPDVGSTWMLPRIAAGAAVGLYIGLTGARMKAADCVWSGMATHFIPQARVAELESRLVALGHPSNSTSGGLCEASIDALLTELGAGSAPDPSTLVVAPHAAAIRRCFNEHSLEAIFAALQKESESGEDKAWAADTLAVLLKMSPTSMKLTFEACKLHASDQISISQALVMEYRMVQRCVLRPQPHSDFYEGIRAVLVDKKPDGAKYNPSTIEAVSPESVGSFFAPLEPAYSPHARGELTY